MADYERNLRGNPLARQIQNLNGHQRELKFVFFEPAWCFMLFSGALSGLIPILSKVALLGLLGAMFEFCIWLGYFIRTRNIHAYPGLKSWLSIKVRRKLMPLGRSAGNLSKPR